MDKMDKMDMAKERVVIPDWPGGAGLHWKGKDGGQLRCILYQSFLEHFILFALPIQFHHSDLLNFTTPLFHTRVQIDRYSVAHMDRHGHADALARIDLFSNDTLMISRYGDAINRQ